MDAISQVLDRLTAALAAALPARVVTDEFVDHPDRRRDQLEQGVVTVLLPSGELPSEWEARAKLTVVGQVAVAGRGTTTRQVRDAELALLSELLAFARNPVADVPRVEVTGYRTSSQMEHPFGWVALDVWFGPIDLTEPAPYPPNLPIGTLGGIHLDIDVPPHENTEQHDKWLAGDYGASRPDLQADIDTETP